MMRTPAEIAEYIELARDSRGYLWEATAEMMLDYLSFDDARPYLGTQQQESVEQGLVRYAYEQPTREAVLRAIHIMLPFAIGKAMDHRSLGAQRYAVKLAALVWLLGDDELHAWLSEPEHFPNYGAPLFRRIAETYDMPWPGNVFLDNMAKGLPCCSSCEEGCGV